MIQWLGSPRFLGQVPEEIVLSVQEALNRESDLRGSTRAFFESGTLDPETCLGLRDWGGGALDTQLQTLVSSWGAQLQAECTVAGYGPAGGARPTDYPWLVRSDATLTMQQRVQGELRRRGSCPLTEPLDGKLGPQTCAAGRYLEQQGVVVAGWSQARSNCQSYSTTWRPSPPCAGAGATPSPVPPPAPPTPPAGGGIGAVGAVALLAGAALAGYFILTQV
jgi:hypothetical protein